jgi:hypothetical protein
MSANAEFDVFVSYNTLDHAVVERLARALKERGLTVFLDRWELVPGRSWPQALEQHLLQCRSVAVVLGPASGHGVVVHVEHAVLAAPDEVEGAVHRADARLAQHVLQRVVVSVDQGDVGDHVPGVLVLHVGQRGHVLGKIHVAHLRGRRVLAHPAELALLDHDP